jgi:hypothetical protein
MAKNSKCPDCEEGVLKTNNPDDIMKPDNIMIKVKCGYNGCGAIFNISKDLNQGLAQRVTERKLTVSPANVSNDEEERDYGDFEEFECRVCANGWIRPADNNTIELKCSSKKCNMSYV